MKSKKKTVSKIIPAGCLVAALMFFLIPCANAADIISVSTAAELEAALQSAADGDTIRLTANIDYTGVLSILDKTIVLDLQNYNLNVISDGGYAVYVGNGGISELKGSGEFVVAGEKFGINAENGGFATVTRVEVGMADEGGRGVSAEGLSRLTVLEDISGYTGVYALNSEVIVGGSIYGDNAGVYAVNGAKVTVEGGAEGGHYGVYAAGDGTVVTVKGDSIATIEDGKGVAAYYGANVAVEYARGSSFGVYAKSNWTNVTVTRGAEASGAQGVGILAEYGATVKAEYANGTACGVKALGSGSYIEVGSVYTSGVGAIVEEATDSLASILITRKIVAYDDYIIVGGRLKDGSRESRTVPSIKAGYHTYNEGNNIVWVKIQTDVLAGPVVLPSSGGNSDITVSGVDQPVLVAAFDGDVAVVTGLTAESEGKQKAVLSFPENTSMTEAKKYTIMLSFDGGVEWFAQSLKITVMPKGAVCRIEAVPYSSLDDAFAAAIDGDTITLLNEIHLDSTLSIGWGGDTNLHLAGYNIIINSATGPGLNVDNRHIYLMGEGSIHVTGTTYGVYATNGGRISVTSAAATDPNGIAVYVYQAPGDFGGSVTVLGNVTSNGTGVKAYGVKSHITVNGNIEGKNYGIIAENGGKVTAEGDVVSQGDAVLAADEGSTITVGGNIVGVCAAKSYSGAEIKVEGNAEGLFGVFADGEESKVTVEGNVKATLEVDGIGAGVENGGAVEIGGSVESTRFGVMANGNHSYVFVKVGGSVTVSDEAAGIGVAAYNAFTESERAEVIVEGIISANTYVMVGSVAKNRADTTKPTTKLGYATYNEGNNTVWVKASGTGIDANPAFLPLDGGQSVITVTGSDLPEGIQVTAFNGDTAVSNGITSGTGEEQSAILSFPANTDSGDKVYIVKMSIDGGANWSELTTTVTVAAAVPDTVIDNPIISGVTPPAKGAVPVSEITETAQYNGIVTWQPSHAVFAPGTVYTAIITVIPKSGYTLDGVPENFFTVAGATASNQANSGVVVAVFPATEVSGGSGEGGSGEGGSGGGGSGGGGSRDSVVTVYYAIAEYAGMQTKLPVTVLDETGNASVRLGSVADVLIENNEDITVSMPSIPEVNSYTIFMDASVLSGPENETHLTFVTDRGSVTVPGGMLYGTGILGEIGIKISDGDKAAFNSDAKAIIGDKPIILLELFADGEPTGWSNTSDPVTVCMPYTPAETELSDLESIIILTADGSGTAVTVPNGRYIPDIGALTFTSNHFGYFAAGYNRMSFNDIAEDAWYCRAVGFIAARGITSGIGGGNFGPDVKLTRGQFIVMLMKSYEIMPDENPRDNFADAGNTYYTGYLAAAKRLGISSGVGNNMFQPDREITRQEMFTLLYNALKAIGIVSQVEGAGELSGFKDADMIAPWAIEAMEYLVKSEIISGSGGELFPASTATRAEMAQVLYNLLSK